MNRYLVALMRATLKMAAWMLAMYDPPFGQLLQDSLAGPPEEAEARRIALVVVDMQPCFVDRLREGALAGLLAAQRTLIAECMAGEIDIVVIEYENEQATIPEIREMLGGYARLHRLAKARDCGFAGGRLREMLETLGVNAVMLTGVNASVCMLYTADCALGNGFEVMTAPQLMAGPPDHPDDDCVRWYGRHVMFAKTLAAARGLPRRSLRWIRLRDRCGMRRRCEACWIRAWLDLHESNRAP